MGPEATNLLQQRGLATVDAQDDADHLLLLIDMNPQVPSRIAHLIDGAGEDPTATLATMAQRLERAGATALAMASNTPHRYAPAIRQLEAQCNVPQVQQALSEAASEFTEQGTERLFVARSDFPLLAPASTKPVPILNTIDVLAKAIHQHPQTESR